MSAYADRPLSEIIFDFVETRGDLSTDLGKAQLALAVMLSSEVRDFAATAWDAGYLARLGTMPLYKVYSDWGNPFARGDRS